MGGLGAGDGGPDTSQMTFKCLHLHCCHPGPGVTAATVPSSMWTKVPEECEDFSWTPGH